MKKKFYHFVCLLFAALHTLVAWASVFLVIAAFNTESNSGGQMLGVLIAALLLSVIVALIDRALRAIDSPHTVKDIACIVLVAPVRLFLEIGTIVKMRSKGADFGARGVYDCINRRACFHYIAWNHQSEESETHFAEQAVRREQDEQERKRADNERIGYVFSFARADGAQNFILWPMVSDDVSPDEYRSISESTYSERFVVYEMTRIWINGTQINKLGVVTPFSLSLKPGQYDIRVEMRFFRTPAIDMKDSEYTTQYIGRKNIDVTKTFEYRGLQIGASGTTRLVLTANLYSKYDKQYYEFMGDRRTRQWVWTFRGWDTRFDGLQVMSCDRIRAISGIPYPEHWSIKPFNGR